MKINGLRWIILSLIMLVSIINYLDRGTLNYMWVANTKSEYPADRAVYDAADGTYTLTAADGTTVVAPADRVAQQADGSYVYTAVGGIAAELGILDPAMPEAEFKAQSKKLLADITIFFMIAYGLSQLFSGKLYDRIGTRRGFAFSALLWGAADAFTAFAAGFKSLTAFRFMLGLGEAGPWPGTTKSNAEWFPTKERALAQGLFNASTSVGSILAPIVISFLYLAFGWKATFAVVGSLAVLWIIPWLWVNKKGPKEHPWITDKERDYILSGQPEGHKTEPCRCKSWGELLRERKNYALIVGRFFIDPVWWIFVTFIPIYLIEVFNLDIREVAHVGLGSLRGRRHRGIRRRMVLGTAAKARTFAQLRPQMLDDRRRMYRPAGRRGSHDGFVGDLRRRDDGPDSGRLPVRAVQPDDPGRRLPLRPHGRLAGRAGRCCGGAGNHPRDDRRTDDHPRGLGTVLHLRRPALPRIPACRVPIRRAHSEYRRRKTAIA